MSVGCQSASLLSGFFKVNDSAVHCGNSSTLSLHDFISPSKANEILIENEICDSLLLEMCDW